MEVDTIKEIVENEIKSMKLIDKFIDGLDGLSEHFKERLKEENQLLTSGRILTLVSQMLFPDRSDEISAKNFARTCKKMVDIFVEEGFTRDEALQLAGRLMAPLEIGMPRQYY